ncbi:hypothetical protein CROQUDRAFT_718880 [Cronartium quercuum f. sp. fusiforme G11]|uniref:U three protein 23 n=1 Tax=Cronartium quercuum f. sp. fusiforme G11 TaxID=708437 RepID=A0A9P6N693_9BASI|nr:hypothetical protein CROQUDRAFT_718880 [Cronartium quercuum f. sp. fusiforme G11]
MKTKRTKANRKTMQIYNSVFKFREPYQVLLDADFMITAVTQKIDIQSRLESVVGGSVKPMITQCSIAHLIQLATDGNQTAQDAVDLARKICERRKCNHWKTKESSIKCIQGVVGETENRLRYLIATQDQSFRTHLRENVIGVPILYVNRSGLLLLEEEGPASELRRKEIEDQKLHVPVEELQALTASSSGLQCGTQVQMILPNVPEQAQSSSCHPTTSAQRLEKKLLKKKRGGPNPLSVKKKKKPISSITQKSRQPVLSTSALPCKPSTTEGDKKAKRKRKKSNKPTMPSTQSAS